jgi:carboxymethylenebutenolidase
MNAPTYASAVEPVAQTAIHTDSSGLEAADVSIATGDGSYSMAAYYAKPSAGSKLPIVLLAHEIWSVHEYFKDLCRRLAKLGYLAVAPDLFGRQGDPTNMERDDIFPKIVSRVPDAQVMADLDACAAWAATRGGDANRLAMAGFCWGGRITWLYAAHDPKLKAAVAWYGKVEGATDALHPKHPLEAARELKAPVLGLYGGADAGIPNDGVDRMREALKAAGKPSEIHTYPDTPHAFHADYRPSYRQGPAEDGWSRMLEWFRGHGVS